VLVVSEEPICRDVIKGCENITNSKISCEYPGAVEDDGDNILTCIWLEKSFNSEPTIDSRCMRKVCFLLLLHSFLFLLVCILCFSYIICDNKDDVKCPDIANSTQCESGETRQHGLSCVWGKDGFGGDACFPENSLKCGDFLTELGCTWSEIGVNGLKMMCEWKEEIGCIDSSSCEVLKEEGLTCGSYTSEKGPCFFNGEGNTSTPEKDCSDVMDVIDCSSFYSLPLCVEAKKDVFKNLPGDLDFPCNYNTTKKQCESIKVEDNNTNKNSSTTIIIVVVIAVVVVLLLVTAIIVVIIILYRRKLNRGVVGDSVGPLDVKTLEMEETKKMSFSLSVQRSQRNNTCLFSVFNM
jgi:hypothetical protein